MGPPLGATLVPTTKVSIFGTGTIQECPRLKLPLEVVIHLDPTVTILNLTVTPITGQQGLYKTTVKTPKTQASPVALWILLLSNRQGYLTTEVL